jgi:hypothetical protein
MNPSLFDSQACILHYERQWALEYGLNIALFSCVTLSWLLHLWNSLLSTVKVSLRCLYAILPWKLHVKVQHCLVKVDDLWL